MIFNSVIVGSGGGGTGATVMAKSIGDTYHYGEGAKVILTPTGLVYGSTILQYSPAITFSNTSTALCCNNPGCFLSNTRAIANSKPDQTNKTGFYLDLQYSEDLSSYTGSFSTGIEWTFYVCDYRDDDYIAAAQIAYEYSSTYKVVSFGQMDATTGAYTGSYTYNMTKIKTSLGYAGKHWEIAADKIGYVDSNGNINVWNIDYTNSKPSFPTYYNGTWYGIKGNSVLNWGTNTAASYTLTNNMGNLYFSTDMVIPLDDEWTYVLFASRNSLPWTIYKVNKTATAWTINPLSDATTVLKSAGSKPYDLDTRFPCIKCKDFGSYVEIFYVSYEYKYNGVSESNVGHFILDKATDKMTRLADVFTGLSDTLSTNTYTIALQVNWNKRIISLLLDRYNSSTSPYHSPLFCIAKYDSTAGIYKYYAYPYSDKNFYPGCMTGVVKENKGVNAIGDWILEVETVEDPDYIFDNSGVLYGMEVTVNPGI